MILKQEITKTLKSNNKMCSDWKTQTTFYSYEVKNSYFHCKCFLFLNGRQIFKLWTFQSHLTSVIDNLFSHFSVLSLPQHNDGSIQALQR